jgi:hypothetical protein
MKPKSNPLAPRMLRAAEMGVLRRHDGTLKQLTQDERNKLHELGMAFDKAQTGVNAKLLLGAWARARRYWVSLTGEPLI